VFEGGQLTQWRHRLIGMNLLEGSLAIAVCVGSLTGCRSVVDVPSAVDAPAQLPATAQAATGSTARVEAPSRLAPTAQASPPAPGPLIALATADAARRTGAGSGDVRIVLVEAREWPDRSLGCPRPGMGYAQAITPGFLIVAEVAGQHLEYHTDQAEVQLCGG
jgi:hypothetical protein